jgi:hypothetical protein
MSPEHITAHIIALATIYLIIAFMIYVVIDYVGKEMNVTVLHTFSWLIAILFPLGIPILAVCSVVYWIYEDLNQIE